MPENKIDKIKEIINSSENLSHEKKEKTSQLLEELSAELSQLKIAEEKLDSVTDFAQISHKELSKKESDGGLIDIALSGLKKSVEDFEEEHPQLTSVINSICTNLSNTGL